MAIEEEGKLVSYVYEMDDGQVIEVYQGDNLPFPLLVQAENDVQQSSVSQEREVDQMQVELEYIATMLEDIDQRIGNQNENICNLGILVSCLVGIVIGFLAGRELLRIWLV